MAIQESQGRSVTENLRQVAMMMLGPPRTLLVVALGTIVVAGRATQWVANRVEEEGERQLARFNGVWARHDTSPQHDVEVAESPSE